MSLFKRVHVVTVPHEFLDKGDPNHRPPLLSAQRQENGEGEPERHPETPSTRQNEIMGSTLGGAAPGIARPAADDRYRVDQARTGACGGT